MSRMLFTTKHCVECVKVKNFIEVHEVMIDIIDAEEHAYLAIEQQIMSVPTLVDGAVKIIGVSNVLEYLENKMKMEAI